MARGSARHSVELLPYPQAAKNAKSGTVASLLVIACYSSVSCSRMFSPTESYVLRSAWTCLEARSVFVLLPGRSEEFKGDCSTCFKRFGAENCSVNHDYPEAVKLGLRPALADSC